jgi:hypothetical protein
VQEYKIKRGYSPDIERMRSLLTECFDAPIQEKDSKLTISYGALKEVTVWIDKKMLFVDTVSNAAGVSDDLILDSNKRFRTFLDKATGYSSKDRVKNAKKEVGGE